MVKNLPANAGDSGSIPESERSPGEENGNPFQYSCLENPVDGGAWRATVHGVAETQVVMTGSNETPSVWAAWPSCTCPSPSVAKSASFLKPALHLSRSKGQDNLCPQLSPLDCLGLNLIFSCRLTQGFWFQTHPQWLPRT